MERGFLFSTDASFSVFLIFSACALFLFHISSAYSAQETAINDFSEFRKASSLLNSFVNDRNETFPLYGCAFYSGEKRRVMENLLDYSLLVKTEAGFYLGNDFFLQKIHLSFEDGSFETISEKAEGNNCFALERFVLVKYLLEEKKAKIVMRFCHG